VSNELSVRLPRLAARFPIVPLATLPTPVTAHELSIDTALHPLSVKHDEQCGPVYGGNKVRKLEYLLRWALERGVTRVATYGAAGSNHALATALYARRAGLQCTCLLSQQPAGAGVGRKLLAHQLNGTEILRFGGPRSVRVALQRRCLQGRDLALIPMGGSNWRGALGFVNAALELAGQYKSGALPVPREVYVATGTLGTAAGLALGFALAGLDIEIRAIRVTDARFANADALRRLLQKTAALMRRYDDTVPAGLADRCRIELRGEFLGKGYGQSDAVTERAIALAADQLGITLEPTYSGKAMAALCHDLGRGTAVRPLFWNTANAVPLAIPAATRPDFTRLPADFARHFDKALG
jgi:1-aminocyclopropane-1-carboxylate deaminase/D-cysteine desulfhydrase-like pyridoxal-dependent ACC family enzyme